MLWRCIILIIVPGRFCCLNNTIFAGFNTVFAALLLFVVLLLVLLRMSSHYMTLKFTAVVYFVLNGLPFSHYDFDLTLKCTSLCAYMYLLMHAHTHTTQHNTHTGVDFFAEFRCSCSNSTCFFSTVFVPLWVIDFFSYFTVYTDWLSVV